MNRLPQEREGRRRRHRPGADYKAEGRADRCTCKKLVGVEAGGWVDAGREGNKASRWRLYCYRKIIKLNLPIRSHQRPEIESLKKARRMCLRLASRFFKNLDIDRSWTLIEYWVAEYEGYLEEKEHSRRRAMWAASQESSSPWALTVRAWMWQGRGRLGERWWCLRPDGKQTGIQRALT